jgi:hypothetical protein
LFHTAQFRFAETGWRQSPIVTLRDVPVTDSAPIDGAGTAAAGVVVPRASVSALSIPAQSTVVSLRPDWRASCSGVQHTVSAMPMTGCPYE